MYKIVIATNIIIAIKYKNCVHTFQFNSNCGKLTWKNNSQLKILHI